MKKIIKRIIFILIILIVLFSISTKVQAWSEIIEQGKDFISAGQEINPDTKKPYADVEIQGLQGLSSYLYNILLTAGVVVAVVVATVLGVQFMIGGAEGQAKVKEMLVPFLAGCVIVFGGFGLWKVAISLGNAFENANSHQYDFSETTCPNPNCAEEVTPVFDMDKKTYVCPKCGQPM